MRKRNQVSRRARSLRVGLRAFLFFLLAFACALPFVTRNGASYIPVTASEAQETRQAAPAQEATKATPYSKIALAFREAKTLVADKQWARAEEKFKEIIELYPEDQAIDAALYYLGFVLKKQSKFGEAEVTLERLIREFPRSTWADDAAALRMEIAPEIGTGASTAESARSAGDVEVRLAALQSLFITNPADAKNVAVGILKSESAASDQLKSGAITLLGQFNAVDNATSALLVDIVQHEQDVDVRKAAIRALWNNRNESVISLLKETAIRSTDSEVAMAALGVISRHADLRSRQFLTDIATSAESVEVRREAVSKLSLRADGAMIDELMEIYQANTNAEIKKHILSAIARTVSPHSLSKLVEAAFNADSPEVRSEAALLIGKRNNEEAIDTLIRLYDSDRSEQVKRAVIFALAKSDKRRALNKVMDVVQNDPSLMLRKEARTQLNNSSDPEVRRFLQANPR